MFRPASSSPNSLLFGKECMAMAVKPVALSLRRWRIPFPARNHRGPTHNTNHNRTQFIPNCLHHLPQTNSWATPHPPPPHPAFLAPKFAPTSCVRACFLPPIATCTAPNSMHKLPHTWHRPPDTPVSPAHHFSQRINPLQLRTGSTNVSVSELRTQVSEIQKLDMRWDGMR
jgi:hypothetical protein